MRSGGLTVAVAAVLAFATSTLTPPAARAGCILGKVAELPATMSDMRALVSARFNGRDIRLIADSGAFYSMISAASAKQHDLVLEPAPPGLYVIGANGDASVDVATVDTFTLAGADLHRIQFLVGGTDVGEAGLLGRNVLGAFDTEYDLGEGAIRLFRAKGCGGADLAYWSGGKPVTVVPIEYSGARTPPAIITVRVNGAAVRALLDTGATQSVMTTNAARRAGIDVRGPGAVSVGLSGGIGRGLRPTWRVTVGKLDLGGEAISNVKLLVSDMSLPDNDMLLGADFFLSHRVLIANSQGKVYITYQGGPVFDVDEHPQMAAANQALVDIADPKDADGFSRRGAAYAERGEAEKAMADLDKAIALDPKTSRYRLQRAQARLQAKQPAMAMDDIDAALKLTPDDPEAHLARAELRLEGGDRPGAKADVDAAAKTAPAEGVVRLSVAELYTELDDEKAAVGAYDSWIADHSDDAQLSTALNGRCWARALGDLELDRALSDCNRAVGMSGRAADVLDTRGLVRLRRGEYARAIADYDDALKRNPKIAWSLYGRGLAELKTGASDAGRADIAAGEALDPKLAARAAKLGLAPPDAGSRTPATATAATSPPPVTHAPT